MPVTYGRISQALDGVIAYYRNPFANQRLLEREMELCRRVKSELGDNARAFYGTGYPFWAYYSIGRENAPLTAELVRFISEVKGLIKLDGKTPHHCLSQLNEARLRTPFREGIDLGDIGYDRCVQCSPTIFQIFYAMPDADIYIIVGRYPTSNELNRVEAAGAGLGFFPLYRNLEGIINSFAAGQEAPMKCDYVFVTQNEFTASLERGTDWQALRVPCMLLRYGTESFRENWLDVGADMVFSLQPFAQHDQSVRATFERYLIELFSSRSSDEILREGLDSKIIHGHFKKFLRMGPVSDSFATRHNLGKSGLIKEINEAELMEMSLQ